MAKIATNQERLNELFNADPRSDSAIADNHGVSKQTISAWRNGSRSPKKTMVKVIAEKYNVSEEWLYGWDLPAPDFLSKENKPVPTTKNGQVQEIMSLLNQLSPKTLDDVLHYIRYRADNEEAGSD